MKQNEFISAKEKIKNIEKMGTIAYIYLMLLRLAATPQKLKTFDELTSEDTYKSFVENSDNVKLEGYYLPLLEFVENSELLLEEVYKINISDAGVTEVMSSIIARHYSGNLEKWVCVLLRIDAYEHSTIKMDFHQNSIVSFDNGSLECDGEPISLSINDWKMMFQEFDELFPTTVTNFSTPI